MTFTDWTTTPPQYPCYAIFRGLRVTGSGRVNELHEPVQIVFAWVGNRKELAVARMRRQELQPLCMYAGQWQEIAL